MSRRLTDLEQRSGLLTISRAQSAASLVILQMLREGDTVADVFSDQADRRRIAAGERVNERVQLVDSLRDLVKNDAARQTRPQDARTALDTARLPQDIQKMTDQFLQTSQKVKVGLKGIAEPSTRTSRRPAGNTQAVVQNQRTNQRGGAAMANH